MQDCEDRFASHAVTVRCMILHEELVGPPTSGGLLETA